MQMSSGEGGLVHVLPHLSVRSCQQSSLNSPGSCHPGRADAKVNVRVRKRPCRAWPLTRRRSQSRDRKPGGGGRGPGSEQQALQTHCPPNPDTGPRHRHGRPPARPGTPTLQAQALSSVSLNAASPHTPVAPRPTRPVLRHRKQSPSQWGPREDEGKLDSAVQRGRD